MPEYRNIFIEKEVCEEFHYYCDKNAYAMGKLANKIIKDYLIAQGVYNFKKKEMSDD